MTTRILTLVTLGASCALLPSRGLAQTRTESDTLTIAAVYALVESNNPILSARRSRVEAVQAMERSAALPPDPQVRLGMMNVGLPGLETDMPASMAPSIEVMQMLPVPGKLRVTGEIAHTQTEIARTQAAESGWMARLQATMAYYEIYRTDRQIETMNRTLRLLGDFERVARARYVSGEGQQADVLRASVEIARMSAEIERMNAMRAGAVARLNAVLNRPPDTPVGTVAEPPSPGPLPGAAALRGWAGESSPWIREGGLGIQQAGARLHLARRELWPDLALSVQYGQRRGEMGTERMGSLMVGFSVPVFAGQRQFGMREEAAAMQRMAEAELTGARAAIDARIGELLAELDRSRTLLELYRSEVLPQSAGTVESAFSSYRVGAVDFMTLVDAQMTVNEYEQQLYQFQAEFAVARAELEMTVGRELPRRPVSTEER